MSLLCCADNRIIFPGAQVAALNARKIPIFTTVEDEQDYRV